MAAELLPCGTYAANQRHYYNGEKPCDECLQARRDYQGEWAAGNRDRLIVNTAGQLVAVETLSGKPIVHGLNCYSHHGCRCDEAQKAYDAYYLTETHRQRSRDYYWRNKHNRAVAAKLLAERYRNRT